MAAMIRCVSIVAALLLVNVAAKTNKDKVRAQIHREWGHVIWGDHIGHDDYLRGIAAVVGDFICEGACGFTTRYLEDLVDRQVEAFTSAATWKQVGQNFIRQLARNPGVVRDILAGNAMVKATVGIASYNHWTDECRFCKPCTWCTPRFNCNDCGTYRVSRPNTHQPYFGFTVRSQTKEYQFSITNGCHKDVSVAIRYLPTGGSWESKCWYQIRPGKTITPASGPKLRTTNALWYYYAEANGGSYTWQGTDTTRTCAGRSLRMRKATSYSGNKLTLRLTCGNFRTRKAPSNMTDIDVKAEVSDQHFCELANHDASDGQPPDAGALMNFSHDWEEAQDQGCEAPAELAISEKGITVGPADFLDPMLPVEKEGDNQSTDELVDPVCGEACQAIEEAYNELAKKLQAIHGRRLGGLVV